jgi:hypothetical protein
MIIVIVSVGGWGCYTFPTVVKIMSYTRAWPSRTRDPIHIHYVRCKQFAIANNTQQTRMITCVICAYAQDLTSGMVSDYGMVVSVLVEQGVVHRLCTGCGYGCGYVDNLVDKVWIFSVDILCKLEWWACLSGLVCPDRTGS